MTTTLKKRDNVDELVKYDYGEDAGLGFDKDDSSDVPWLKLLQSNSTPVIEEIPGAKAGVFYNTATDEAYGDKIHVLIACETKVALEHKPDGGGFVASHSLDSPVWIHRKGEFPRYKTESGNNISSGYTLTLLIIRKNEDPVPVVFTCDFKKAKEYRRIKRLLKKENPNAPSWAFPLEFSVVPDKNPSGQPIKGLAIKQAGDQLPKDNTNYIAAKVLNGKLQGSSTAEVYEKENY